MKKALLILAALALISGGYYLSTSHAAKAQAASMPNLTGIAFISGEGGHIALVNLADWKSPTDLQNDRIAITEAGSEMEGTVAGIHIEASKGGGGMHSCAIIPGNKLVVSMLDGNVLEYDMKTGTKTRQMHVGNKFCDTIVGPNGKHIYFTDMADGHVYEWDWKTMKLVDKIPVGLGVCGIGWTRNQKYAYVSDMPAGTVDVIDWKTKKIVKQITDPQMTFLHQGQMTPDGSQFWVSAPNEFDPGLKPPTHKSQIVVISTKTNTVIDHIIMPPNRYPHDLQFTPDGKWVLIPARTYQKDSRLMLMNAKTHEIVRDISVCQSCHDSYGIQIRMNEGHPNLCGITVAWGMKNKPRTY